MIPKIIHQMWIGDMNKCPARLMVSWKEKNPQCIYILWTEDNLKDFKFQNQKQIDMMPELNGKCDIMRYEILHRYGGFFADADSECINTLDDFFWEKERFACWENEKASPDLMSCAFMGMEKNDPLLGLIILDLGHIKEFTEPAWVSVGPRYFTNQVNKWKQNFPTTVYPSHYFIPVHGTGVKYEGTDKVYANHYWGSTFNLYGSL